MTERMLIALSKLPMRLFAIDEAHCISRSGPAFRTEYRDLQNLQDRFPNVPVVALTTTADASRKIIKCRPTSSFQIKPWPICPSDNAVIFLDWTPLPNKRANSAPLHPWPETFLGAALSDQFHRS